MNKISPGTARTGQKNHGHFLDAPQLAKGVTRFWLIRHALVEENARAALYGTLDVPLCPDSLVAQRPMYEALARRLPEDAQWFVTSLSRTRITAETICSAGYGRKPELTVIPAFLEQDLGEWQGLPHNALPEKLRQPGHVFWPMSGTERPPGGESMTDVCARVGAALNDLAERNRGKDMVIVSHGGTIRAAIAHALRIHADTALHFSIQNLSLTILEQPGPAWRVVTVNELPGI
ncbi:histidine phosphatase family protein [Acetobacter sp. AN02]|uniref:histidine phosphatase family protein n=1 Tax=Acetobacter sp. AN02 TaxID=2894186 RepID=UPI0024342BF5|nr:histidine phosphatase family protein [Acetobacter sp. AN02]MDG6095163.1 histidine phosphatase family protein [Acetobacter sp. AN02]